MARRNDHSREEIKDMAVAAAITMLNEHGVAGLSTRKVAKAIGYTAGTLYLVFKNLDEMILEVNAATLDELNATVTKAVGTGCDARTALKAMAQAYLKYAQQNPARWSLLFSHRLPDGEEIPAWLEARINALFDNIKYPLQSLQPDLDEQSLLQATRELWSGVHGACDLGLHDKLNLGGRFKLESLIDSLVENYLRGFAMGGKSDD